MLAAMTWFLARGAYGDSPKEQEALSTKIGSNLPIDGKQCILANFLKIVLLVKKLGYTHTHTQIGDFKSLFLSF
jgi:hypothetical protein